MVHIITLIADDPPHAHQFLIIGQIRRLFLSRIPHMQVEVVELLHHSSSDQVVWPLLARVLALVDNLEIVSRILNGKSTTTHQRY